MTVKCCYDHCLVTLSYSFNRCLYVLIITVIMIVLVTIRFFCNHPFCDGKMSCNHCRCDGKIFL